MPAVQFFDFSNRPTFLFFRWIRDGGGHDPGKLVAAAMDAVEGEEFFEIDGDVSLAARDALARMLNTALGDVLSDAAVELDADDEPVQPESEWLIATLLRETAGQIDLHCVAQALLVGAGKWAPDTDLPEGG
jgi:hypothetical protein